MDQQENKIDKNVKKRNWAMVLYPESAPKDWKDILTKTGLEIAISPIHDKDVNPDGTIKKPHYHIILCYPGPTTYNAVRKLTESLNQPIPIPLESVKGMYRYFTHMDNPDKYQYDEKDIQTLGGFDVSNFSDLSSADKSKIKLELTKLISENSITEYSEFIDYVVALDKPDYFMIASSNTIYFNAYIRSMRHKNHRVIFIDKKTGEIIEEKD